MKLFVLPVLVLLFSSSLSAKVLVKTIGQVKSHVITSRELSIHEKVKKNLGDSFESFQADSSFEQVIKEWLLYLEAIAFYNTKISEQEVKLKKQTLLGKLKSEEGWSQLQVTDQELTEKVRRRLEAERLYTFKKKASVLPVSLGEVETEYTQNRVRYGALSFEEAKPQIQKNKVRENLQRRLKQWFRVLEKKYKVQRFTEIGAA